MARWRAPQQKSSPYITPEGEQALKSELKELWALRRQDVVPALQAAAAEGDRSENAEYIYRKKQLGQIDRRVRYLSKRLDEVEVVHLKPPRLDKIHFGATVRLQDIHRCPGPCWAKWSRIPCALNCLKGSSNTTCWVSNTAEWKRCGCCAREVLKSMGLSLSILCGRRQGPQALPAIRRRLFTETELLQRRIR
jgi:hypothetical protein